MQLNCGWDFILVLVVVLVRIFGSFRGWVRLRGLGPARGQVRGRGRCVCFCINRVLNLNNF